MKITVGHHQHKAKRTPFERSGFTLTEIIISIAIIMVLVTGAMGYQYNSMRAVKISEVQATASRIAMLILEGWKGQQGDAMFNPVDMFNGEIAIQTSNEGLAVPDDSSGVPLVLLGTYEIFYGNNYYYATLAYEEASDIEPKLLNVTIAWRTDYTQGEITGGESFVRYSTFLTND